MEKLAKDIFKLAFIAGGAFVNMWATIFILALLQTSAGPHFGAMVLVGILCGGYIGLQLAHAAIARYTVSP